MAGLKTKPGSITEERGHVVDLMATCLELANTTYPEKFAGETISPHESKSLVPVLSGGSNDRKHAYLFNHSGTHAVVRGDYKIVREGKRPWALYNLAKNRTETIDLAKELPQVVADLATIWEARWGENQ